VGLVVEEMEEEVGVGEKEREAEVVGMVVGGLVVGKGEEVGLEVEEMEEMVEEMEEEKEVVGRQSEQR